MKAININKIVQIVSIVVIVGLFAWMGWRIFWLESGATKQYMWHEYDSMRINNLKECLKRGDTVCPESKYADSKAALERISAYDRTLPFSQ